MVRFRSSSALAVRSDTNFGSRERVIAGTDCGFGTLGAGDEVHPETAWAKLSALVEGARIASRKLWAPDAEKFTPPRRLPQDYG